MPNDDTEDRQVSVRLPASLAEALEAAADARDVSKSRLVARAVERYLAALAPAEQIGEGIYFSWLDVEGQERRLRVTHLPLMTSG